MKGANKYENFVIKTIDRENISAAPYNPRKISDDARKKLKKFIKSKDGGLLAPLVWNERTGTLVSGHQRLSVLDMLHNGKPYKLTIAATDQDESSEIKANLFMNNPSAQGEWDVDILSNIVAEYPDIDLSESGFTDDDIKVLIPDFEVPEIDVQDVSTQQYSTEEFRERKKKTRDSTRESNADGNGLLSKSDFSVSVVFNTSEEKRNFMADLGLKETDRYIPGRLLSMAFKSTAS